MPALSETASLATARAPRPRAFSSALSTSLWPLAGLVALAVAIRFPTLNLQSFWYDEAYTPVHVLHSGLTATLHAMVHSENSPPLWYLIAWADARVFGDGEIALRMPSAIAGVLTVPLAWGIGAELCGRRCALVAAALVAVNPLFVWYSQEARVYALFVFTCALALLCFLRALREPSPGRLAAFSAAGALALLSHYFSVFLLAPMALWLLRERARSRAVLPAVGALALVGLALLPLLLAQGGHGTQWIGRWALSSRLAAIPQYYLTGYSGAPLGHGVELLVALPVIAALGLGAARLGEAHARGAEGEADPARAHGNAAGPRERAALPVLATAAAGILLPVALALLGADYLAPRNLVAAMVPLTALIALAMAVCANRRLGAALAAVTAAAFLAISIDIDLSPRLQRGNWRGLARALGPERTPRAISTVELGGTPLQYYLHGLRVLRSGAAASVSEIDATGYAPLRRGASRPPAPGFALRERRDIDGLIAYRFFSAAPREVSASALRRRVITRTRSEALVGAAVHVTSAGRRG